ncbi:MAG TPA: CYTH domain-containing protein [Rheinheimera sp.]|nr:CYTH domain-containing protein [Rheinheimera sp.]
MSTELELKFLMPQQHLSQLTDMLPQLGHVAHSESSDLLNAYYDTADNWFRRHDMGLRTRLKRGRYEQTIKLAGAQHGAMQMRPEYNLPCDSVVPVLAAFPAHIWPEQTDISVLQQALTELFRTDFHRKSWQLKCDDGSVIELVYDAGQVIAAGNSQAIAELELELISGNAANLFNLAQQLIQQLPLRTGWLSKAARGYQLAKKAPLVLPQAIGLTLLQQIKTLQQAEACYQQQAQPDALAIAREALSAIAQTVADIEALQHTVDTASALAASLAAQQPVFAEQAYNQLLLTLSQYLFEQA